VVVLCCAACARYAVLPVSVLRLLALLSPLLSSPPLGSTVSAGGLVCLAILVVVHLKHAHALVLALALALALRLTPTPASRLVLHLITLLSPSCICAQERSIHIHAYPYPSPSPRLLIHPRAASVTIPIQEPCSLRCRLSHSAPRPSRRRTGLLVALTLSPIALCIVCSHCRPRPNVPVLYCCCCRRCVPATRREPQAAHRRNGRRETPTRLPDIAAYDLGSESTHLPSFASRHARSGILDLPLSIAQSLNRHQYL